jgi:hypothetical protein
MSSRRSGSSGKSWHRHAPLASATSRPGSISISQQSPIILLKLLKDAGLITSVARHVGLLFPALDARVRLDAAPRFRPPREGDRC